VSKSGETDNDNESKANVSTIKATSEKIARQNEGDRIINACFANDLVELYDGSFAESELIAA